MKRMGYLAASILVMAGWSAGAWSASINLLQNGSFEVGTAPGSFTTLFSASTAITDWTVGTGSIDYIGSYWAASDGLRSLDLSGNGPGSISQIVSLSALNPGQKYLLTFDLAGNPDDGDKTKTLDLTITNGVTSSWTYTFDATGKTKSAMGWERQSYLFEPTSAGNYVFTFASGTSSAYGPALDNAVLTLIPIPAGAILFPSLLAGLALVAKRRKQGENAEAAAA